MHFEVKELRSSDLSSGFRKQHVVNSAARLTRVLHFRPRSGRHSHSYTLDRMNVLEHYIRCSQTNRCSCGISAVSRFSRSLAWGYRRIFTYIGFSTAGTYVYNAVGYQQCHIYRVNNRRSNEIVIWHDQVPESLCSCLFIDASSYLHRNVYEAASSLCDTSMQTLRTQSDVVASCTWWNLHNWLKLWQIFEVSSLIYIRCVHS